MDVDPAEVKSFEIKGGDFLVVRGNGNKRLAGKGGVASGGLPLGCIYPDLLIRLRFDPRVMITEFAAEQWNSACAHGELMRRAKTTNGIWKINGRDIRTHKLVVPPIDTQRRLLDRLEVFRAAADEAWDELESVDGVRASLLAEIFGGI